MKKIYLSMLVLAMGLSACKKDKKSSTDPNVADLTVTVMVDDDKDPMTPSVPAKDAVVEIYLDQDSEALNANADLKDKQTDSDGNIIFEKINVAPYYLDVEYQDANMLNFKGEKSIIVLPGVNQDTVTVK